MPRWLDRLLVLLILIGAGATFPDDGLAFSILPIPPAP